MSTFKVDQNFIELELLSRENPIQTGKLNVQSAEMSDKNL